MRTETIDPLKLEKLPVWAQNHIRQCEADRDRAIRELRRFIDEKPESNLFLKSHTLEIGDKVFLPDSEVTFILGERSEISVRIEGNKLHVMGSGSVRTGLVIHPRVTNVVDITLE